MAGSDGATLLPRCGDEPKNGTEAALEPVDAKPSGGDRVGRAPVHMFAASGGDAIQQIEDGTGETIVRPHVLEEHRRPALTENTAHLRQTCRGIHDLTKYERGERSIEGPSPKRKLLHVGDDPDEVRNAPRSYRKHLDRGICHRAKGHRRMEASV